MARTKGSRNKHRGDYTSVEQIIAERIVMLYFLTVSVTTQSDHSRLRGGESLTTRLANEHADLDDTFERYAKAAARDISERDAMRGDVSMMITVEQRVSAILSAAVRFDNRDYSVLHWRSSGQSWRSITARDGRKRGVLRPLYQDVLESIYEAIDKDDQCRFLIRLASDMPPEPSYLLR